jgi:hypothetical protein
MTVASTFTFTNMQDDCLDICQEIQGRPDFNAIRVKRMINQGCHAFIRKTNCLQDIIEFTTVANQQYYTATEDSTMAFVYKVLGAKYITDGDTEFGKVLYPYPGGYNKLPQNIATGDPTYYYTLGLTQPNLQRIGTYPIISTADETLQVRVYRDMENDLSTGTDVPKIPIAYREAPVFYAVWRLYHAYSHLSREFKNKALEHKALFDECVDDFKFNNFFDNAEGEQVQDAYDYEAY